MKEEKRGKIKWLKEKIKGIPKIWICVGIVFFLLFALVGYFIYDFIKKPYQIPERYQLFMDLLIIILTISGLAIGALGYVIYQFILEHIENSMKKREEEFLKFSSGMLFTNVGYSFWLLYEDTKKIQHLNNAIIMSERAFSYIKDLDERDPKNEFLKCQLMNNFGYYLAERGDSEDREFAIKCAEFIKNRIDKYPEKRQSWQRTYDHIIRKYHKD